MEGRSLAMVILAALFAGCVPLRHTERAATSTMDCMRIAMRGQLPAELPDKVKHCRATGLIAARCSATEARLAGIVKEVADLLGPGNAELADLRADFRGVRCARADSSAAGLESCCSADEP